MKEVEWRGDFPRCDSCNQPGCGVYNAPTSRHPRFGAKWANLCGPCFTKYGLDTSVTELRVRPQTIPTEVTAMAAHWVGEPHEVVKVSDDVWRFWSTLTGETYDAYKPGAEFPCFEDSGRPCGNTVFPREWAVRAISAAPDDWFTVDVDGTFRGMRGEEVKVW